ncbi:RNA chaperone Hfq [uncultured Selenomonas sp.]|uniref:RNA chaperone Hfq n=1 Tax=uncultured Selenomonas sp. TaxID=159275 RepID=UPI0028D5E01A|nr:RNA chaperone Hfq [uncultured Selenomonas sp.]
MTAKTINLQDNFLNQVRRENIPVTIHLVNGFQMKGSVRGFDSFVIIIDSMGKQQMIYKHAISTITPAQTVKALLEES